MDPVDGDNKFLKDHLFEVCYYMDDRLDYDTQSEQSLLYDSLVILEKMNLTDKEKEHHKELGGSCYEEWKLWMKVKI